MSINTLKKRHAVMKGTLTRLVTFSNTLNDTVADEDIRARLVRANNLFAEFVENENALFEIDEKFESEMEWFENKFYHVVAKLNSWLKSKTIDLNQTTVSSEGNNTTQSTACDFKLPRCHIPPFDGNYKDWISFYDLFTSCVHENKTIPAVQKFQYLKGLLIGDAANLVKHFTITEANYIEAFQKLCSRYSKKQNIVTSFLKTFIEQPSIKSVNSSNIRKISDTTDEVIRGLKALGTQAEARDPWIIYIIFNKLDDESKQLWIQETADIEFPTTSVFLKFLNKRSDMLENLKPTNMLQSRASTSKNIPLRSLFMSSNITCPLCEEQHYLNECSKFLQLSITDRRNRVRELGRCFNCLSDTHIVFRCRNHKRCKTCKRKHDSSLHLDEAPNTNISSNTAIVDDNVPEQLSYCGVSTLQGFNVSEDSLRDSSYKIPIGLLPTALINVEDSGGEIHRCRILLDSGSQHTFITEACVQRLRLPRENAKVAVSGICSTPAAVTRGITEIKLISQYDPMNSVKASALILSSLAARIPAIELKFPLNDQLKKLNLADPTYNIPGPIDILVGISQFLKIMKPDQIKNEDEDPIAQDTMFGWVIAGEFPHCSVSNVNLIESTSSEVDIDRSLKRFWEVEEVPKIIPFTDEEKLCEAHFEHTYRRLDNGRFVVRLPFKKLKMELDDCKGLAIKRLKSMMTRFQRDVDFKNKYQGFMDEYEMLNHMEYIPDPEVNGAAHPVCYLPHYGVLKEHSSTTKLRVVFDASARSTTNNSLNDYLMIGPTIQSSLLNIVQRFRLHKIVLKADIEKMYRQVLVDREDINYQRIVWQREPSSPMYHYRLLTVTYGTASAPYLATKVLSKLSEIHRTSYPNIAQVIENDFYIDDLLTGAETIEEAQEVLIKVKNILSTAGFNLRKWASNDLSVLKNIPDEDREMNKIDFSNDANMKILGIEWFPLEDTFKFSFNMSKTLVSTKRNILSEAARIFDPLGWLSPTTISIKIFFQQLWVLNLGWDDKIPFEVQEKWEQIRSNLTELQHIVIPRWVESVGSVELHGFSDASEKAYAATVYCRTTREDGTIVVSLVASKTKVAPIKQISIPRLELCAAVLLSKLMSTTVEVFKAKSTKSYMWTDSSIVLAWLSTHPRRWKTFVANRTSEILDNFPRDKWQHVSSNDNPADCASRGIIARELIDHPLWWHGPSWLSLDQSQFPNQNVYRSEEVNIDNEIKDRVVEVYTVTESNSVLQILNQKFSIFSKMVRVLATVKRFITVTRTKKRNSAPLNSTEIKNAQLQIIQWIQYEDYRQEIDLLKQEKSVNRSSKLKNLNPFLDDRNNLRVGGRIQNSTAVFEVKHPLIVSGNNVVTEKLVAYYHQKYLHAGPTLLINILKQQFWIINCRNLVRKTTHSCITCFRYKKNAVSQIMGELPEARVTLVKPFLQTGVDYAGPISLKLLKGRSQKTFKAYICIFVCLSIKAVHIELVSELTTEAFIAALRRFVARRGACSDIFSDNGTNFVDANINWHFISPASPHQGGLWEAAVKSTKYHLKRVIGDQILTYEEMITLLVQIEATLNSRPLCVNTTEEIDALTPAHFLVGHPIGSVSDQNYNDVKISKLSRYQMVQQIFQNFWKRWHIEYLTALQARVKWQLKETNVQIDDVVLIKENNLPPSKWLYGRIVAIHPGKDAMVRVVSLRTKNGIIKRSVQKICLLPLH